VVATDRLERPRELAPQNVPVLRVLDLLDAAGEMAFERGLGAAAAGDEDEDRDPR
jgi:hypothetical protein